MNNREKANSFTFIVMFVASIVIFMFLKNDLNYILKGETRDAYDIISSGEELKKGEHVSVELVCVVDWYAELTTTRKGIKTVTYHALGMLEDGTIISICAKKNSDEYIKIDNLIEKTYDYLEGTSYAMPEPLVLEGSVQAINSKISTYYSQGLSIYGFSSNEAIYLDINTGSGRGGMIVALVITIVLFVVPIVFFVIEVISYKNKQKERTTKATAVLEEDPIFNNDFYETYKSKQDSDLNIDSKVDEDSIDTENVNNYKIDDKTDTTDITDDHDDNKSSYPSKFNLKKD